MPVFDGGAGLQIPVTPDCLGRLLDIFGRPLDGGPPLVPEAMRPIVAAPVPLSEVTGAGDVLLTGTPSGVGPLLAGQRVSVEIDGIGTLTNPVVDDTDDLEDADSVAAK